MGLRPYQLDALNETRRAFRDGYKSPCIVAPCGYGKTCVVAEMARAATAKGNRVLFLVHRRELCGQAEETFRAWGVDMSLCSVGMVQTVARRLAKTETPGLIVTDENHHCLAASYRKIYDYFKGVPRVGVTATPVRLNGSGLGDVSDKLVIGKGAKWLAENGFLAPFDYYAPTLADMEGVRTERGEYRAADAEERLRRRAIFGDVVGHYKKLCAGEKAICYCVSVAYSRDMAAAFNAAGVPARHIDGETPDAERAEAVESFRNGETLVLCNVDLISEGFDVPDCKASILLRPTKSLTLFIQQSMRCMRHAPGKRAVVIDHVGNVKRHGLPDGEREWSLCPKKEKSAAEVPVKICPGCFLTVMSAVSTCPHCGHVFAAERRKIQEIKETALTKINGFVLDYTRPEDCTSYRELIEYGKNKKYKPGWAWHQAKRLGYIS